MEGRPEGAAIAGDAGAAGGPPVAVVVPVKAFGVAKVRLSGALDHAARAALARSMAERVLAAAQPLPVAVVCDDDEVADWAHRWGAHVVWCPGRGLNGAVGDGVRWWAGQGARQVIVAHADLPHADDLVPAAESNGITLVPDRREDGTNVICLPASAAFGFAYGPGSFTRHCAEARRLGLPLRILRSDRLGWDVDLPADLVTPSWLTG